MTFAAFETAQETGQPVEVYEFTIGAEVFRLTSNEVDVTLLANIYQATVIKRGRLQLTGDDEQDRVTVEMPSTAPFVQRFISSAPGGRVGAKIRRFHRNDPDLQVVTLFDGAVQAVKFDMESRRAHVLLAPATVAFQRQMPRMTFQGLCNHMLYDARCKIVESDPANRKLLPVTAVSGSSITCTGAGSFGLADFFEAGFVTFQGDHRLVVKQTGDVLELLEPFAASPLGSVVTAQKGCKHRLVVDCQDRFNNVINFGGFPFVPLKNIFETGLD